LRYAFHRRWQQPCEAIDWAMSENGGKDSPFCARIATDQIAVSGWSCGGLQALINAGDPRVKTG